VNKRIFLTLISLILVLAVLTTGCAKAASGDQSLKKFRMPRPWSSVWTTLSRPWDTAMSPTKSSALTLMWPKKSPSAWVSSSTPADRLVPEIQRTQCRYHRLHLEWLYHHRGTSPADQRHISLHENRQIVVVLADSPVQSLADLAGKKLALQAESSAAEALESNPDFKATLGEVIELKDNVTALLDLKASGSDALLVDEIVAGYYIAREGKQYRILDEALAEEEYGVGFRKADQALRDEVQKQLEAMAKDGTLAKISTEWFSKDITTIGK